jgi:hypothetical protein
MNREPLASTRQWRHTPIQFLRFEFVFLRRLQPTTDQAQIEAQSTGDATSGPGTLMQREFVLIKAILNSFVMVRLPQR